MAAYPAISPAGRSTRTRQWGAFGEAMGAFGEAMMLPDGWVAWFVGALALGLAACGRGEARAGVDRLDRRMAGSASADCSGHTVCAEGFLIDVASRPGCVVGAQCIVTLQLVARGDFHVNDDYPYRFNANETPGVRFEGTDAAGKTVFSKPMGDWRKTNAKSGQMTIRFTPTEKGRKTIAGTFKLSVCSAETCLLEQREVSESLVAE